MLSLREALDLARQTGDPWLIGITLVTTPAATTSPIWTRPRRSPMKRAACATSMWWAGRWSSSPGPRGDLDDAIAMYRSSIALAREAGSDKALGGLTNLAFLLLRRGELIEARTLMTESMGLKIDTGSPGDVAAQVADFSVLCAAAGDPPPRRHTPAPRRGPSYCDTEVRVTSGW